MSNQQLLIKVTASKAVVGKYLFYFVRNNIKNRKIIKIFLNVFH